MADIDTATTPAPEREGITLATLRDYPTTLFVRNNGDTLITCTVDKVDFQLAQRGSPESMKVLPKEIASYGPFQKLWQKKIVTISNDPDMENEITLLTVGQNELEANRQRELVELMQDSPTSKALVEKKCLISGERVFQTMEQVNAGEPPLTPRFADLAPTFVRTQIQGKNGPEFTFTKAF